MNPPTPPQPNESAFSREVRIFADSGPGILVATGALRTLMNLTQPEDVPALMLSVLREVFGPLSDASWQRVYHAGVIPCPQVGCDCHIQHSNLLQVIEHQREIWRSANAAILGARQQQQKVNLDG